jgi:hypothetical protein
MGCFLEWNNGYVNNIADVFIASDTDQRKAIVRAMQNKTPDKSKAFCDFIREAYTLIDSAK